LGSGEGTGARFLYAMATFTGGLARARELLDDSDIRAVSVSDDRGDVLGGVRLQLKLGFTAE